MRLLLLIVLVLWVQLGDLVSAWLYGGGTRPGASMLRPCRDLLVVALASGGLLTARMPVRLWLPMLAYGAMAVLYLLMNLNNTSTGILIGSFGTLLIPLLFFLTGYYCVRQYRQLRRIAGLLLALGIATTLFGAWEQQHTDFWLDTLKFAHYIRDIKGVLLGAQPETGLPWNFYANNDLERRSAGLLAAPLAQGMFLAIVALVTVAWAQRRQRWLSLALCSLLFLGIWMSGTRGAMLAGSLALLGYLLTGSTLFRHPAARLIMTCGVCLVIALASYRIVQTSVKFEDGSTIGHWEALQKNLQDLPKVLLLGTGIGAQGAVAAQNDLPAIGGGEGAIFSIAFQLGLPAALLFLWFYATVALMLLAHYRTCRHDMALVMFWLSLGLATTLISSDHLLTVSGTSTFWLLCGAALRSLPKTSHPAVGTHHEDPPR